MVKVFKSPQSSSNKKRVSLRLPVQMLTELDACIRAEGKNKKQRSAYISEAIGELKSSNHYKGLVPENWLGRGDNTSIQITLNQEAETALNEIETILTKISPSETELASAIIRTAIIQKILKEI